LSYPEAWRGGKQETPRSSKMYNVLNVRVRVDTKFRMTEWKFIKGLNFYLRRSEKVSWNGYYFRIGWDFHALYKFYRFLPRWGWDFGKSWDLKYIFFENLILFHEKWLSFTQTADIHKKGLHSQKGCNNIMQVNFLMSVSDACFPPLPWPQIRPSITHMGQMTTPKP
jgi:hypothetical protein